MKLKIGARRHEANEWLTSSKIPQFQGQVFSTADAHIAYWCHNSKSSECRDLHTGLSSMSSASSPERGQCVPNTSQTVRSRWKRAFPSWSVRFAYLGPVWLDQNQIWVLKSGSWNHGVVNKQNVESESGFLKTNAKSGSRFYPDVVIHQFYPYEFYQNVVVLFH